MSKKQLTRAWKQARHMGRHVTISELRRNLKSRAPQERLLALMIMRHQLERGRGSAAYLKLARPIVGDRHTDCRWQALIVVGHFIPGDPLAVWRVVLRYGASADPDLRAGIATVLLEHLLEHNSRRYVPLVESALSRRRGAFADMVARCWTFEGAKVSRVVNRLLKKARHAAPAA